MGLRTGRLHLRLVMEGVECPIVAATWMGTINQTSVASIQIVPTPTARRIPFRTMVHLFEHDLYASGERSLSNTGFATEGSEGITMRQAWAPAIPETAVDAAVREAGGETAGSIDIPPDMLRYRLAFVGEVVGRSYQKTASGSMAVVLQCAGPSNYWDMPAADRKGGMLFGGGRRGRASGLTPAPFWDLLKGDTGQVFEKLTEPPASFPNLRGFTAGLIHLLEELVGVSMRRGREGQIIAGKNQFMAMAALRLRLLQTIGVAGGDDSPLRLLRRQGFGSIWRVALRGLPRYFSYRHLINALMPYTFYETVPVLGPHYTPPTGIYANYENWAGYDTGFLRNSPQWAWVVQKADSIKAAAHELIGGDLTDIDTQHADEGSVDATEYADVVSNIRSTLLDIVQLAGAITQGVTESRVGDTVYKSVGESGRLYDIALSDDDRQSLDSMTGDELAAAGYRQVTETSQEAIARLRPVAEKARAIDRQAATLYQRMGRSTTLPSAPDPAVQSGLSEIAALAEEISNYSMPPPGRRDDDAESSEPSHLYCDIFRPDVWFCAPPRSNVIFPDHIVRMSESRVFGQEPTRLMIRMYDKWLGSDILFDKWWIAPTAPGLFSDRPVGTSGSTACGGRLSYDLMDHELMGGIVPIFQTMSDREMYLGARVAGYGSEEARCGGTSENNQKRYFQQVTNFILFRTRFAARNISFSVRHNPYLILGFPALLMDSPPNQAATTANQLILSAASNAMSELDEQESSVILELIKKRAGQHFLGTIQQLTHTADATGESCSTDGTLTYVREHNEKIEFMGQDLVRMAQTASRGTSERTVRRRSAAVERVLRELQTLEDVLSAESTAGMSGRAYTDGLIQEPQRIAQLPVLGTGGGTSIPFYGSHDATMSMTQSLIQLYQNLPMTERQALIQLPSRRTTVCFAINTPQVREGTPPEDDAEGEYTPGQLGPNGYEMVEVTDITDQFRNTHRRVTSASLTAEDQRNQGALAELEADLAENEQRLAEHSADMDADSAVDTGVDDAYVVNLRTEVERRREDVATVNERTTTATLPFLGSPHDGRNRPITTITTDRVGIPTDIRDIPQLVGILGTDDPTATGRVTLRVFRVVEDTGVEAGELFDLGAEDILRPPWYSNVWTNGLIGGGVYLPYFGVGSVVDPIMILAPDGLDVFGTTGQQLAAEQAALRSQVQHGTTGEGPLMSGILEGATIENAVDFLVHSYALTKASGYDVDSFIRNYTWRPIATMFDIFGSGDLVLDGDGNRAVSGVEGFHSRAFGPHSNLFGLLPYSDIESLLGIDASDPATAARVDVRSRRYAIIQAYRMELLYLRGCAAG
jgi:hypothetical protein